MLQKYLGKRNQNNRKGVVGKYRQTLIIGPNSKVSESDIYFLLEFFGFDGGNIQIQRSESSYHN